MMTSAALVSSVLLGYIGPGGGIALLGPLLGVILAVAAALAMVSIWPIRFLLRKLRASKNSASGDATTPQPHR